MMTIETTTMTPTHSTVLAPARRGAPEASQIVEPGPGRGALGARGGDHAVIVWTDPTQHMGSKAQSEAQPGAQTGAQTVGASVN